MCGLAGLLAVGGHFPGNAEQIGTQMANALWHRGPDDGGVWTQPGVMLANRRLAVLDLTAEGHLPRESRCGRYAMAFNGEVYNFRALRADLAALGHRFRGMGDSETVAAAFSEWGIDATLLRLNGMYAIAVWDRHQRQLTLVRDRLGQKPLYFGWVGRSLIGFASELKALHMVPGFSPSLDRRAAALVLRRAAIPAPYTVYEKIWKLSPGCSLTISPAEIAAGVDLSASERRYWSAVEVIEAGVASPLQGGPDAAADAVEAQLGDAVELCLESDVPLGALLSGGIDSSLVTALMVKRAPDRVRTFSIGFTPGRFDEAPHAAAVAQHLGTEHTELYVTENDALAVVEDLPRLYDEPFADSSQIPTYLVSKLARQHVTVALTGDGGDELFGGYRKYADLARLLRIGGLPRPLLTTASWVARRTPLPSSDWWRDRGTIGDRIASYEPRERVRKLADILSLAQRPDDLTLRLLSLTSDPATLLHPDVAAAEPLTGLTDPRRWPQIDDPIRRAMAADMLVYLPADILAKVDRASMAVSLETRVPLLDHRVIELAARMPAPQIAGKAVLQNVLHRHVPAELVDRPKMGFSVPLGGWLLGPLHDWATSLLEPADLAADGIFDSVAVTKLWRSHEHGHGDRSGFLWPILMFRAWQETWTNGSV